jgi:hypothetical protein
MVVRSGLHGRWWSRLGGESRGRSECCDHVHLATDQVGGERRQSTNVTLRNAILNYNIATIDDAGFVQTRSKQRDKGINTSAQTAEEETYHWHSRLL